MIRLVTVVAGFFGYWYVGSVEDVPGEKVVDFMNIHHWEENYAEIVEKASWQEIETPKPVYKR